MTRRGKTGPERNGSNRLTGSDLEVNLNHLWLHADLLGVQIGNADVEKKRLRYR